MHCLVWMNIVSLFLGSDAVKAGDDEFVRFNYQAAASVYESILQNSPGNPEVLWRLSRVYICMGDIQESREQRESMYRKSVEYARLCVAADGNNANGYAWLGASLGSVAMFEGSRSKVKLCNEIKSALDRAIALDPNNDIAYTILGSFYRALGNISWLERQLASVFIGTLPPGGRPEAEKALKKAIAIAPNVLRHHYELGMVYYDDGKNDEAKKTFEYALKLPITLTSDYHRIERIKKKLVELNGETK
ncbi:tetratricopeptide repeat protein [bacterium]|nr:tetratricopeptide repeat protein [bacterium]